MSGLVEIPIQAITSLTSADAVQVIRSTLRAECRYSQSSPAALTVSSRLTVADGGIDAEVSTEPGLAIPPDCLFQAGLTGFQIKSGTAFKPWTQSSIRAELLNSRGELYSEVERLVQRRGRYTLISTGHDLTPQQRNEARDQIQRVLAEVGYEAYEYLIDVLGASQLADFVERYPGVASSIITDPIQEALVLNEWQQDAHMSNSLQISKEQTELIDRIRSGLIGDEKHLRILGEPGLGKTRIVLEAVRDPNLAPYTLYIEHGSQFGQSKLFRQLLKSTRDKPLVLVLDELPESDLAEIWRHLKTRCGALKIVSLDHGRDETQDAEIQRLYAPRLADETIKQILVSVVGESRELIRWVEICEGSPRVAQAVAENLRANPEDLLRSPTTVPLWDRFLHGYGKRDEQHARQIDCVTQHLALFSRFGYEPPVGNEARYIADLVKRIDPTIGWARFQEIVQGLRARRVLQGSRTLFFVPKALQIYLWKRFWQTYGRELNFTDTFIEMPESLHVWFMNMFKFAGDATTAHVIDDILKPDGIYSEKATLTSRKGSRFLSTLAEANSVAVLKLLETTIGKWQNEDVIAFREHRQNIVWTLEKIAVWPQQTVRAIRLLVRLSVNETDTNSNNATGTVIGLFRIGPEAAATESTPAERLPAALELLRSSFDTERELGLRCMVAALDTRGMGYRIVGPEHQGLKERAKLWIPKTYGEWWEAYHAYFQALVSETKVWPEHLRSKICSALLDAIQNQIKRPPCTQLAFDTLETLIRDPYMNPSEVNKFLSDWREYHHQEETKDITARLDAISRAYTQRDIKSRFQRYVIDVDWMIWDDDFRERRGKRNNRAQPLVSALAKRIANRSELLEVIMPMLAPQKETPALWHFGAQLALHDHQQILLPKLLAQAKDTRHWGCLGGYLDQVRNYDIAAFHRIVSALLAKTDSAWLGAELTLRSGYDESLFTDCLEALEVGWIEPSQFSALRYGRAWQLVSMPQMGRLIRHLHVISDAASLGVLIGLFDDLPFDAASPFTADTVFNTLVLSIPGDQDWGSVRAYDWKNICEKIILWDNNYALPLLDALLTAMGNVDRLSYDSYVAPVASGIVRADPVGAWQVIRKHFEVTLPKWRGDLLHWLKGGLSDFNENNDQSTIAYLPLDAILTWIEHDPTNRAGLIAHAAPGTLDDDHGGQLTRALLSKYPEVDGVRSGISATFHSGSWTGPMSAYLKRRRDKLRSWLSSNFDFEVTHWLELELEYLDKSIDQEEIVEERERFE